MSHPFETQLAQIRETLLMMSSLTDRNLSLAMRALVERDNRLADAVETEDSEVDKLEVAIDEMVITYMATHGPVARDCRLMLGASKISTNLERIADQATTIARRARALNGEPPLTAFDNIPAMAKLAQQMLHDAITAFVEGNADLAQAIIPRDKEVDAINRQVAKGLAELMMASPENVNRALNLLTIAKAIERAADHAQNIAEEVYFLYSARDIRHGNGAAGG
ncbi:MAG: phosphate signaling complex protein PhoU [Verrucomicrobiota bacterium]